MVSCLLFSIAIQLCIRCIFWYRMLHYYLFDGNHGICKKELKKMIIDCISDLHGYYPRLEGGDVLVLGGDYTARDKMIQWGEFFHWLKNQPYRKKILIAGNHDNILEKMYPKTEQQARELAEIREFLKIMGEETEDFEYLCDSGTEFEGVKFWGSPWSLHFFGINPLCTAFTGSENKLAEKFAKIPENIEILITHIPPYGILDLVGSNYHAGSKNLLKEVCIRSTIKFHVFGHIHEDYGKKIDKRIGEHTTFINASHVNRKYQPVNPPIRIVL